MNCLGENLSLQQKLAEKKVINTHIEYIHIVLTSSLGLLLFRGISHVPN